MSKSLTYWLLIILFFITACSNDEELFSPGNIPYELPAHFEDINYPDDNPFTIEKWELGKALFYSPLLSKDKSISCATCHKLEFAFGDNLKVSDGIDGRAGTRNVPSIVNTAFHPYFTREGGVPTLEMQVLVPIQEHNEFDFNIVLLAERLEKDPIFNKQFNAVFGENPNAFGITRAIATFERSLISSSSTYDKYLNSEVQLTLQEQEGKSLFFSERLGCSGCHSGFNFSDYSITNNGLYENYADVGKYRLTLDSSDLATFKTPSLRNIELTAPYMHDGSISSLEEVILHYEKGIKAHYNLDERIKSFSLSDEERDALIQFLKTLTDHDFIQNTIFKE